MDHTHTDSKSTYEYEEACCELADRLAKELAYYKERGVKIMMEGGMDAATQEDIARICAVEERGCYLGGKRYSKTGKLREIYFVRRCTEYE